MKKEATINNNLGRKADNSTSVCKVNNPASRGYVFAKKEPLLAGYKMAKYLARFLFSIFSGLRRSQEHKNATKNEANI